MPRIRRIVTGEHHDGESTITHVEEVAPVVPQEGFDTYFVWGWDKEPTLPFHTTDPYEVRSQFPGPGGLRISVILFGSNDIDGLEDPDVPVQYRADKEKFINLVAAQLQGRVFGAQPGMHRTDTIDIGIVLSGEVTTEATDGTSVTMGPGDIYVQNGAMHRWVANPDNPALVAFVFVPAARVTDSQS